MRLSLKHYITLLISYLRPEWPKSLSLAVVLLGSIGLQLAAPQLLRRFIDTALAGGSTRVLGMTALAFLGVTIATQILSILSVYLSQDVSWSATNALRADVAEHCLKLDLAFHNSHTPGEFIERIDGDITALSNFFSEFTTRLFGSMLLLVGALVMLFREDWRVGLALTLFVLLSLVILQRVRNLAVAPMSEERQISGEFFGYIEERLSGIDDIRANGGGQYAMLGFHHMLRRLFHKARQAWMMHAASWMVTMGVFAGGMIIAFSMGAYLFTRGMISLGTVYLFFQYTEMLRTPLEQITRQIQDLQKATVGIVRVRELLSLQPQVQDGVGGRLPDGALAVEFDRVSFAYEDEQAQTVLRDIAFHLKPGRVLGLLGRTGSGKTTLTKLLFRFYDPTAGSIRLNGIDIRTLGLSELRSRIGMVTQEVQLFHATVRNNLTFFDPSIDDEQIIRVLNDLGLGEWYRALPNGLDTLLLSGGSGLSAGQSQLLAFARIFLKNPGLVILDEPSSRLDPSTERLISRAIDQLLRGRTCIVIAHRLATVERADDILILDHGRVSEFGPREVLADDPDSRFAQLLHAGLETVVV